MSVYSIHKICQMARLDAEFLASLQSDPAGATARFALTLQERSALLAGGLLAFALSFDEIVVTTFTAGVGIETLPQWIFNNMFRPNQLPTVNVVAVTVILLSVVPVYLAQRISSDPTGGLTATED